MSNHDKLALHWTRIAKSALVGRTIVGVRYTVREETDAFAWARRALVIVLDNGHLVWAASDEEGNDAGALFTTFTAAQLLPALPDLLREGDGEEP